MVLEKTGAGSYLRGDTVPRGIIAPTYQNDGSATTGKPSDLRKTY